MHLEGQAIYIFPSCCFRVPLHDSSEQNLSVVSVVCRNNFIITQKEESCDGCCHINLTWAIVTRGEGTSIERSPLREREAYKVKEGSAHCGQCHPWVGGPQRCKRQAEQPWIESVSTIHRWLWCRKTWLHVSTLFESVPWLPSVDCDWGNVSHPFPSYFWS